MVPDLVRCTVPDPVRCTVPDLDRCTVSDSVRGTAAARSHNSVNGTVRGLSHAKGKLTTAVRNAVRQRTGSAVHFLRTAVRKRTVFGYKGYIGNLGLWPDHGHRPIYRRSSKFGFLVFFTITLTITFLFLIVLYWKFGILTGLDLATGAAHHDNQA